MAGVTTMVLNNLSYELFDFFDLYGFIQKALESGLSISIDIIFVIMALTWTLPT